MGRRISPARRALWVTAGLLLCLVMPADGRKIPEDLLPRHKEWAETVDLILTKEEWKTFLELEEPYQRDGFIDRFWKARDPFPETQRNEFKEIWDSRVRFARENFHNLGEDRAEILLLNGEPDLWLRNPCPTMFLPVEFWLYKRTKKILHGHSLIFYTPQGQKRPFLWRPSESVFDLLDVGERETIFRRCPRTAKIAQATGIEEGKYGRGVAAPGGVVRFDLECILEQVERCGDDEDAVEAALLQIVRLEDEVGYSQTLSRLRRPPEARDGEWLMNFAAYSTELPEGAATIPASFEVRYPGRQGGRTAVQGLVTVTAAEASTLELAGRESYSFLLTGEVLRGELLFEAFRYRYDFAVGQVADGSIPIVFQRLLRPGEFEMRLKLEDLHSGSLWRHVEALTVPKRDGAAAQPAPSDPVTARLIAEVDRAFDEDRGKLQLVRPPGEMHLGMVRFDTLVSGLELDKVTFYLDGQEVLTKRRPPYSVEVDLGKVPRLHEIRVVGFDAGGAQVATDALQLNTGRHRFSVELVEPRPGLRYRDSVLVRARVQVPEGQRLDRLELYLGDDRVATLYQPPFSQAVALDGGGGVSYLRAVGYLEGGSSAEDVILVNAPDLLEEVDVQLVEIYAAAFDGARGSVLDLTAGDFKVLEDGVPQTVTRFDRVRDLPIHAAILLDTSASMEDRLPAARAAALDFFEQIVTPKDRVAFITFNDRPDLAAPFTNDLSELPEKLAFLAAERGTALWDSLIFALHYMNGIRGQRAIVLLSDGEDESSRYTLQQTREFALTAGVTLYAIGLDLERDRFDIRSQLSRLAEATGGRAFFIKETDELAAIYSQIQNELRSKYLLAYQSSNDGDSRDFRQVEVVVARPGVTVEALRGYYP